MKVFRSLRHSLLHSGKVRKYMLYALGEIVLVVVGILIALSINKQKEAADLKNEEIQLYRDIITELEEDLHDLEENAHYNLHYLGRYGKASQIILNDKDKKQRDTLAVLASELPKFSDFKNNSPIYDRLVTSGEQDLVTDKEVLADLKRLGVTYNYLNRLETNHQDYMYLVLPKIADMIRINPPTIMDVDALYGYRFQNDIEILMIIMEEKKDLYQDTIDQVKDLIDRLEDLAKA